MSGPLKSRRIARTLLRPVLRRGALVLALGVASFANSSLEIPQADAAIVERIVAVVGQHPILLTDLRERAMPYLLHIHATIPEGPQRSANISQVYKAILDQMIDEELEQTAAREAGVEISDTQVDQALAQTAAQNNLSVNDILAEAKRSGLSIRNYREELRRQLVQRSMVEMRLRGRVRVAEPDIRAAYRKLVTEERMRAAQRTIELRIPRGKGTKVQAKQKKLARELSRRANSGEDLKTLISEHSNSSGSGLRPPMPPMQEPVAIQRATMALEIGETSAPLRDGNDWVLLQVIERPPSQLPSYQEARAQMHERVYMEKIGEARKNWLKGLRRRTHVEVRL